GRQGVQDLADAAAGLRERLAVLSPEREFGEPELHLVVALAGLTGGELREHFRADAGELEQAAAAGGVERPLAGNRLGHLGQRFGPRLPRDEKLTGNPPVFAEQVTPYYGGHAVGRRGGQHRVGGVEPADGVGPRRHLPLELWPHREQSG